MQISPSQVETLAPDKKSYDTARKLAKANNFSGIGSSERALWGVAHGSANYATWVDFNGPAYKCSCPSFKIPCKHVLGLLILVAQEPTLAPVADIPQDVQAWLDKRDSTQAAKQTRAQAAPKDEAAAAKRVESREANIQQGLQELSRFLEDSLRIGLGEAAKRSGDVWETLRARLIDAQAKGLSSYLDWIRSQMGVGPNWTATVLRHMARLHLLVSAYRQLDHLDAELAADVRERIGWKRSREEVLQRPGRNDTWLVLGTQVRYEAGLNIQSIWLWGTTSQRFALIRNFATEFNMHALEAGFVSGSLVSGTLHDYSGYLPMRGILLRENALQSVLPDSLSTLADRPASIEEALLDYTEALLKWPWLDEYPLLVRKVRLVLQQDRLALADEQGAVLTLSPAFKSGWEMLALCGDQLFTVFGTYSGMEFLPFGVGVNDRWHGLNPAQEATS